MIEIHMDAIGVCRVAQKEYHERETQIHSWPKVLSSFAPAQIRTEQDDEHIRSWEQHWGGIHLAPQEKVHEWYEARSPFWTPDPLQTKSLRSWLKQLPPAHKLDVSDLHTQLKNNSEQLPFLPSKKDILRALDSSVQISLYRGYVHGRLTKRRIREKGFICWRYASQNGTRGTDVAAYFSPEDQPQDVILHILKWSWKHDPLRAFAAMCALGVLRHPVAQTNMSIQAHPAVSTKDLHRILGCSSGIVSAYLAGKAQTRAKKLLLCGAEVVIDCTPSVSSIPDPNFFLPRNRHKEQLFSLYKKGIQLDEEGRYSLTPESFALEIAQNWKHSIVVDAFCGCGGNAIAFARQPHIEKVIAIEIDTERLQMAQHNAEIYKVSYKIQFIHGDARVIAPTTYPVFADPPWGQGISFLEDVRTWLMQAFSSGIMKLPIHMPMPNDAKVKFFCTAEDYPSFLLQRW